MTELESLRQKVKDLESRQMGRPRRLRARMMTTWG
jgi:hypothetical protein